MTVHGQELQLVFGSIKTVLPVEIAFLASHGVAPSVLSRAGRLAETSGLSADEILLRLGLVDEEWFYRSLATELGLPYLADCVVDSGARYPESLTSGLAPLSDGFVFAPRADQLSKLLARRRDLPGLSVTSPSRLRKAVFTVRAQDIARQAADGLAEAEPWLSIKGGLSARQFIALGLCLVAGLAWQPPVGALMFVASLVFLVMIVLRLGACLETFAVQPSYRPQRLADRDLPVYSVIVPLYRERKVLDRLIAALSRLDYPFAKLDIKLMLEENDHGLRAAVAALDLPGCFEVIVAPCGRPQTKPRALNVALPLLRGDHVVVYDAEDVPDPDQLRLAVAAFARAGEDVACLQARLVIDNTADSWLTRCFTIEYAALFDVLNPGLAALGCPVLLGGTSNHFRTGTIRALHGWDAWNVTEDADLGIRLSLAGYRVMDLPSATLEEAPAKFPAWLHQRMRWMKGFMQVCIAHSRRPLRSLAILGWFRFTAAFTLSFGTVFAALGYPFFMVFAFVSLWDGHFLEAETWIEALSAALALMVFMAGSLSMLIPALIGLKRRGWTGLMVWLPILPLYYLLVSFAAWRGLVELVVYPSRWNKTEHGLALTSRSGVMIEAAPLSHAVQDCASHGL